MVQKLLVRKSSIQMESLLWSWHLRKCVCHTSEQNSCSPTPQEMISMASISEARGDANNSIKIFHCPPKASLWPSFELETQWSCSQTETQFQLYCATWGFWAKFDRTAFLIIIELNVVYFFVYNFYSLLWKYTGYNHCNAILNIFKLIYLAYELTKSLTNQPHIILLGSYTILSRRKNMN